jgi:hypothetical protein
MTGPCIACAFDWAERSCGLGGPPLGHDIPKDRALRLETLDGPFIGRLSASHGPDGGESSCEVVDDALECLKSGIVGFGDVDAEPLV